MISQLTSSGHNGLEIWFKEKQTRSNQVFKQNISSLKGGREKHKPVRESYRRKEVSNCVWKRQKPHLENCIFPIQQEDKNT